MPFYGLVVLTDCSGILLVWKYVQKGLTVPEADSAAKMTANQPDADAHGFTFSTMVFELIMKYMYIYVYTYMYVHV